MAPIPTSANLPADLLLILTFPTPASLLSQSHFPIVSSSARRSSSLLVLIKFGFTYTPSLLSVQASTSSSTGSTSNGSSSSASVNPTTTQIDNSHSSIDVTTTSLWDSLQHLLAGVYGAATQVFIAEDRPLTTVNVVLKEMRALGICFPSTSGETIRFDVEENSEDQKAWDVMQAEESDVIKADRGSGEYEVAALGGTFDHLHAGHKILLTMAAFVTSQRLIVGVTDENLLKNKKFANMLEPINERQYQVQSFLELIKPAIQYDVVPIQDVFGPTAHDPEITALIVSEETREGGTAVNNERAKNGLSTLDVLVIKLISSNEKGSVKVEDKMGSTGIREWILKSQSGA